MKKKKRSGEGSNDHMTVGKGEGGGEGRGEGGREKGEEI